MSDPKEISFTIWTSISLFHNVAKNIAKARNVLHNRYLNSEHSDDLAVNDIVIQTLLNNQPLTYKAKVKLHGSNCGVNISGNEFRVQSRNKFATNAGGYRQLICKHENYWTNLVDSTGPQQLIVFGEYCGPKVQKTVALAKLKSDIFAVFAIEMNDEIIFDPKQIETIMTKNGRIELPENVYILPWYPVDAEYIMNFLDKPYDEIEAVLDTINEEVAKVDKIDPWVAEIFNIHGPGEGLVLYPVSVQRPHPEYPQFTSMPKIVFAELAFKAKGEAHQVVESKKPASLIPESAKHAEGFAKIMCPIPRLEQGVAAIGGYNIKNTKEFIAWIINDVQKEGECELEASNLTWKEVGGPISKLAVAWFINKIKNPELSQE